MTSQTLRYTSPCYSLEVDPSRARLSLWVGSTLLAELPLRVAFESLEQTEQEGPMELLDVNERGDSREFVLSVGSSLFEQKTYTVRCNPSSVEIFAVVWGQLKQLDYLRFFAGEGKTTLTQLYAPRFDWSQGKVLVAPQARESLACQQWLSPPPFYYGLQVEGQWVGCGLAARPGSYNFQSFDYSGEKGLEFSLTYEGHQDILNVFETPKLVFILEGQPDPNDGLKAYVDYLEAKQLIPKAENQPAAWWREPLFCGWGEQRLHYRLRHDNDENGWWVNAGDLANELLYRRSLETLERNGINPGTVIIDCFWSLRGSFCQPDPLLWQDMKGFIAEQHAKGRKVLLWLSPIMFDGMPLEACMTLGGQPIATDPTSPVFQKIFAEEIRKIISPQGLDADGFKIDFTQNIPAERQNFRGILKDKWSIISDKPEKNYAPLGQRKELIQTAGAKWGVEILRAYLEAIHTPMKAIKPDALLITHTPNPYLRDVSDMLRLNDLDGLSPDVLGIMSNRAAIAHICGPHWLIDTDNDLMMSKQMWRDYIALQPQIGVPDTYYASGIAMSGEMFDEADYKLLRETWAAYRKGL